MDDVVKLEGEIGKPSHGLCRLKETYRGAYSFPVSIHVGRRGKVVNERNLGGKFEHLAAHSDTVVGEFGDSLGAVDLHLVVSERRHVCLCSGCDSVLGVKSSRGG